MCYRSGGVVAPHSPFRASAVRNIGQLFSCEAERAEVIFDHALQLANRFREIDSARAARSSAAVLLAEPSLGELARSHLSRVLFESDDLYADIRTRLAPAQPPVPVYEVVPSTVP
jgi:hypothetical protein